MHNLLINNQFLVSIIGCLSMLCSGAAISWLTPITVDLQSSHSVIPMTIDDISWIQVVFECGLLSPGVAVSYLADSWGRKTTLLSFGPLMTLSWLFLALIKNKVNVYILRFIQGGIVSIPYTILPFYLAEISQPDLRGAVTSIGKIMWHVGMLYSYTVGAFIDFDGYTYCMTIPSIIFAGAFFICPESPYFLVMKNRRLEAFKTLTWLRSHQPQDQISSALREIEQAVEEDKKLTKGSWKDLLGTVGSRKALFLSQFIAMTYIMSGSNVIGLFETNSMNKITNNLSESNIVTIILGLAMTIVILPSTFLADRVGRRPLLLISCFGSAIALLIAAIAVYLIEIHGLQSKPLIIASSVSTIAALCFITFGLEPVVPIVQGELFSSTTRGLVSGITIFNAGFCAIVDIKIYQIVETYVGLYLMYLICFFFVFLGFLVIYFCLPETKNKPLEEIQRMLASLK